MARLIECAPKSWLQAAVRARSSSRTIARWTDWFAAQLRQSDYVAKSGAVAGLRFSAGVHNGGLFAYGTPEADTEQALVETLRPGMIFYDVGANFGLHSLLASRLVAPGGSVIAFEPLPENRALLDHNLRLNNCARVRCLPFAVGCEDGEATFLVSSNPSCGSLPSAGSRSDRAGTLAVEVRRLDTLIAESAIPPPGVVKMDIEGGEVAALEGADSMLTVARPVMVIELHDTAEAVTRDLIRHGYKTSLFTSSLPTNGALGNSHIVAIPSEHPELERLFKRFRDPDFPLCDRCRSILDGNPRAPDAGPSPRP